MKRLLLINNGYPSKRYPNYTTYIETIYKCLNKAGCDIDLIVIKYNRMGILSKIIKYIEFSIKLFIVNLKNYDYIYINHPPYALPIFLKSHLRKMKFNVFLHWHGNDIASDTRYIALFHKILQTYMQEFYHIIPSKYFQQKIILKFNLADEKTIISPSGGVDTTLFKPNKNLHDFTVGFSAALSTDKGMNIFLGIIRLHEHIKQKIGVNVIFKAINYGDEATIFNKIVKEEKLPVDIINKMRKDQMPSFYNSIDILVMPSTREGESLGLVALEAMSCNVPVITYDICAFPEFILSNQTGERVFLSNNELDDICVFIDNLIKMYYNYGSYSPRQIVLERYSQESVIKLYSQIFSET